MTDPVSAPGYPAGPKLGVDVGKRDEIRPALGHELEDGDRIVFTGAMSRTRDELEQISAAWHTWAGDPDGWFSVHHGEILCHRSVNGEVRLGKPN